TPQLGVVLVDGRNLAHFDPDDYRLTAVAYVPARSHAFDTGLKDNVAIAARWISDATATQIVHDVWLAKAAEGLAGSRASSLPQTAAAHLSAADDSRLGMARLAAKSPRIAILDTPVASAEGDVRDAFEHFLESRRGSASVLFSTDDPAMARFADKVLVLSAGSVA